MDAIELTSMADDDASGPDTHLSAAPLHLSLEVGREGEGLDGHGDVTHLSQSMLNPLVVAAALDEEGGEAEFVEREEEAGVDDLVEQLLEDHSGTTGDQSRSTGLIEGRHLMRSSTQRILEAGCRSLGWAESGSGGSC